jgi:hypothetical protein
MEVPIKTSDIKPSLEFYTEVVEMQKEADKYLLAFRWCLGSVTRTVSFKLTPLRSLCFPEVFCHQI